MVRPASRIHVWCIGGGVKNHQLTPRYFSSAIDSAQSAIGDTKLTDQRYLIPIADYSATTELRTDVKIIK
jgi:hypothetical protein